MTRIFDQSGNGNHLHVIGESSGLEPVGTGGRLYKQAPISGTNASADPLFINGHRVYSAYFEGGMGFRNQDTQNIAVGGAHSASHHVFQQQLCTAVFSVTLLAQMNQRQFIW